MILHKKHAFIECFCTINGHRVVFVDQWKGNKIAGLIDVSIRFGLSGKLALQTVQSLSGGEQTKVKLCCLALQPTHLLVLDEPTTHLDINVKSALKQALIEYSGAVIVVSHEREFVDDWPDRNVDVQAFQTNTNAE
ncbi:hypothetical protein BOO24_01905 [Vibrio navarrensis]|uniref:ATP-binding cassette domain-containing protein n=1 Tax=Vibrio navarrensis TaxID=29495 RepID=UPI00186A5D0F|nr:ATP-binding cassette domain-containing protein [Vibrio navarrensis]MBE4591115.1 hypothetical protein [Vibrio navarrensis]